MKIYNDDTRGIVIMKYQSYRDQTWVVDAVEKVNEKQQWQKCKQYHKKRLDLFLKINLYWEEQ